MRFLKRFLILGLIGIFALSMMGMAKEPALSSSSNAISYLSEENANEIASQRINSDRLTIPGCPWNQTTKIDSTLKLFDYDGNANYFLFRLVTNSAPSGYILVDAFSGTAGVEMTCYDADAAVDVMFKEAEKRIPTSDDHIICAGTFCYAQLTKDGHYKSLETQQQLGASKDELKGTYQTSLLRRKTLLKKQQNSQALKGRLKTAASSASHRIPNLDGWRPYVTSDFNDAQNCVPTAATSFVNYWATRHPNKNLGFGLDILTLH